MLFFFLLSAACTMCVCTLSGVTKRISMSNTEQYIRTHSANIRVENGPVNESDEEVGANEKNARSTHAHNKTASLCLCVRALIVNGLSPYAIRRNIRRRIRRSFAKSLRIVVCSISFDKRTCLLEIDQYQGLQNRQSSSPFNFLVRVKFRFLEPFFKSNLFSLISINNKLTGADDCNLFFCFYGINALIFRQ